MKLPHLELVLLKTLEEFPTKKGVVLAISGGIDSMCLAHSLYRLVAKGHWQGKVVLAHLFHPFTPCDREDREMREVCRQFATQVGWPLVEKDVAVWKLKQYQKDSLENLGRKARYQFLKEVARSYGFSWVMTAHHRRDLVESLLEHLLRGTGIRGLQGIRKKRSLGEGIFLLRPWLSVSKEEIEEYARIEKVPYVEDPLNQDLYFFRNRVRHILLPKLYELQPQVEKRLYSLAKQCQWAYEWVSSEVLELASLITPDPFGGWHVPFSLWEKPKFLLLEVLRLLLDFLKSSPSFQTLAQLVSFPPKRLSLKGGIEAFLEKDALVLMRAFPWRAEQYLFLGSLSLSPYLTVKLEKKNWETFQLQKGKQNFPYQSRFFLSLFPKDFPLLIRRRRAGDRFRPLGAPGRKKLKKAWTDRKIPARLRDQLVVVESQTGEILAVEGIDIADSRKIQDKKNIYCLSIERRTPFSSLKEAVVSEVIEEPFRGEEEKVE